MSRSITSYKCPGCSAPLDFDPSCGDMVCGSCGSHHSISDISSDYENDYSDDWSESDVGYTTSDDGKKVVIVTCPSCSAELMCEHQTISTECPYCDNNLIVNDNISGTLRPDYIIPFELTKVGVVEKFKEYCAKKKLVPQKFRRENKVENLKGLYVPFWMYSGKADADVTFIATKSHSRHISSSTTEVTVHEYRVDMRGEVPFELVPVDASIKMDNDMVECIEPYDYEKLCTFDTTYMSGHVAEKFDVAENACSERMKERVTDELVRLLKDQVTGYDSVTERGKECIISVDNVHYALMPVYTLAVTWCGKTYDFMINGQTGKIAGDLPISWVKIALIGIATFSCAPSKGQLTKRVKILSN